MDVSSAMPLGDIKLRVDDAYDFYDHSKTLSLCLMSFTANMNNNIQLTPRQDSLR